MANEYDEFGRVTPDPYMPRHGGTDMSYPKMEGSLSSSNGNVPMPGATPLEHTLDMLSGSIAELDDRLSALRNQMSPVLSGEKPSAMMDTDASPATTGTSTVVMRLSDNIQWLKRLASQVEYTLSQLEV